MVRNASTKPVGQAIRAVIPVEGNIALGITNIEIKEIKLQRIETEQSEIHDTTLTPYKGSTRDLTMTYHNVQ